jgi:signal transduction histidine kinase
VVIVVRDITREIEADRAKRDFIATVSHELRTPLTPIRGFVDLLMLGALGPLADSQKDALTTVKNNTMRMLGLVEDLLEIGRLEAGKIQLNTQPSNLNQLVRDIVSTWQLELERKRMTMEIALDDSLPLVDYDTKRVGQVLTNLVSNAIKYTKDGGAVWVRTFRNNDGMIQLDVQDTGVGLKPEDQRKLFQRFFRADSELREQAGGTGLGLSIARSFIELHHGDMWVTSIWNEGSTFSFTLPERQPRPDLGESEDIAGLTPGTTQAVEEATP